MSDNKIVLIPVDDINILNPRVRNRLNAAEISQNIYNVGLKRPITVRVKEFSENGKKYDLVCGQGRLEAFIDVGVREIPAIIKNISVGDAAIMSLVENIARRKFTSIELLQSVKRLKNSGYNDNEIALKTGLDKNYIHTVVNFLEKGEERVVRAIETKGLSLSLAFKIASEPDTEIQKILLDAHESGEISGNRLVEIRKLLIYRKKYGKKCKSNNSILGNINSTKEIMAIYKDEIKNKKRIVKQTDIVKNLISISRAALYKLFNDINFKNQLKVEGIDTYPEVIKNL